MTDDDRDESVQLVHRIRRAQGQLGGVIRMLEEGRDPGEVVSQLKAVKRALSQAGFAMLVVELRDRTAAGATSEEIELLEKLFLSLS